MRFSVCTDAVYRGLPTAEAIRACAGLGFRQVEFWSWWDKDIPAIQRACEAHGASVYAFCTLMVSLVDPAARAAYLEGLSQSLSMAQMLGARCLITQVGDDTGEARAAQRDCLIEGLREAAVLLEKTGITLLVEPLNTRYDHPGYYLSRSDEGFEIIRAVNSPRVQLLFDIYHQQITEGDILNAILQNLPLIGHLHAAGQPGRHELPRSELDYAYIFSQIDKRCYEGLTGLEYMPLRPPEQGLLALKAGKVSI